DGAGAPALDAGGAADGPAGPSTLPSAPSAPLSASSPGSTCWRRGLPRPTSGSVATGEVSTAGCSLVGAAGAAGSAAPAAAPSSSPARMTTGCFMAVWPPPRLLPDPRQRMHPLAALRLAPLHPPAMLLPVMRR